MSRPMIPRADAGLPPGVTLDDPHARFASGMEVGEAVRLACAWWDGVGRHLVRNPDFRNPDIGLKSGIMRGLPFADLSQAEASRVVVTWHAEWERRRQGGERRSLPVHDRRLWKP